MSNNKRCYLCKSDNLEIIRGTVRDNQALKLKRCRVCGLVFLSSFNHVKNNVYNNPSAHRKGIDTKVWLKESRGDDRRRLGYCLPVASGKKILDFGCGVGGFLIHLKGIAKILAGVDIDEDLTPHFRSHDIQFASSIEEVKGRFDLITMFHILEHLEDPISTLNKLKKKLVTGGSMLIEVPNFDDALRNLYACESYLRFYWSYHLFLYNADSLTRLFHRIKAKVKYIKYIQRYPLSNHLYWLTKQQPGGHLRWNFIDSAALFRAYEKKLASLGMTDTLLASVSF